MRMWFQVPFHTGPVYIDVRLVLAFAALIIGICVLDANKLKDAPNERAAICGPLSFNA